MKDFKITLGFHTLGFNVRTHLLDTNVWSSLASSTRAQNALLPWLQKNNTIASLSMFTIFELSRAENMHKDLIGC
jgi:predicted nucleic acid-binding protein